MQIAIVTAWYPSKSNPLYGVFIQNQAQALADHCSVVVLLMKWSIFPYTKKYQEGKVTVVEKGSFYLPNSNEGFLSFWASNYVRFFSKMHQEYQFDLVHCHDHYGAFVGDKIKKQLSLPYLCTIHNSNILNDKLVVWKKAYLPRVLGNADKVISVSGSLASTIKTNYHISEVAIIPNYIDTEHFNFQPKKDEGKFQFLFVGGLESHKGVLELVKAFHKANLEGATLLIVGGGILENELKSYVKDNGLTDVIVFKGEISNQELPAIYNTSNAYVSVSEYETFGVTVLEAMSCGLPVLYTCSGGPDELVESFAGIEIQDRTIDGIAKGLEEIVLEIEQFDGVKIRNHVIENFGAQKSINALLDEYKMILDAKA